MSQAKHTPGPWVAIFPEQRQKHEGSDITMYDVMTEKTRKQLREEGLDHYDRRHEDVANVSIVSSHFWRDMADDEAKANARLIAAAPELLEALHELHVTLFIDGCAQPRHMEKARAAIAKATGEAEAEILAMYGKQLQDNAAEAAAIERDERAMS